MKLRGVFITGTGTGVGKTVVAAGLLRWLRRQGIGAAPMKPIQTGCIYDKGGRLVASDLDFALRCAGLHPGSAIDEWMCPYRYEPAASPHLAGRLSGKYPDIELINNSALQLGRMFEALVVEGAGGVLVPIDEQRTMRDLIVRLGLPAVVVAGAGLGTINHTLLTLEALRASSIPVIGVVYNDIDHAASAEGARIREDNPRMIERLSGAPCLGQIGRLDGLALSGDPQEDATWKKFEASVPGLGLIAATLKEKD